MRLEVSVAGRKETKSFAPKTDLSYEFVWDRRDAYGRAVQGRQPATIRIGYVYGLRRYDTPGRVLRRVRQVLRHRGRGHRRGPRRVVEVRQLARGARRVRHRRRLARRRADRPRRLGARRPPRLRRAHAHALPRRRPRRSAREPVLDTARQHVATAGDPRDVDVAPDGRVWIANAATDQVIRFDSDGNPEVMAGSVGGGGGCENCKAKLANATTEDDPLAKGFPLARPMSVALAPDGGFYIADYLFDWGGIQQGVIYRVDPAGRIDKIAGCLCNALGDGGPALDASMTPLDLAVGADGTLYLADYRNARIRAIDADGTIRTVAGGGDEASGYRRRHPRHRAPACTCRRRSRPARRARSTSATTASSTACGAARRRRHRHHGRRRQPVRRRRQRRRRSRPRRPNSTSPQGLVARRRRLALHHRPRPRPACQHRRHDHDRRRRRRRLRHRREPRPRGQRALRRRRWASTSPPTGRCSSLRRAGSTASRGRSR